MKSDSKSDPTKRLIKRAAFVKMLAFDVGCGRIRKKYRVVHVQLLHKVCVDALRGMHPLYCIAYVLYQSFVLSTQPRGQGGGQRGKCVAFLKKQYCFSQSS